MRTESVAYRRQLQGMETELNKVIIGQQTMIHIIFCALLALIPQVTELPTGSSLISGLKNIAPLLISIGVA